MKDLTVKQVEALKPRATPYRVSRDLYMQVKRGARGSINRSWLFRYMLRGKAQWMGLGACDLVTFAEAREKVLAGRKLLLEGIDPIEARDAERMKARLEAASTMTFQQCGKAYIAAHAASWRNPKHPPSSGRRRWRLTPIL